MVFRSTTASRLTIPLLVDLDLERLGHRIERRCTDLDAWLTLGSLHGLVLLLQHLVLGRGGIAIVRRFHLADVHHVVEDVLELGQVLSAIHSVSKVRGDLTAELLVHAVSEVLGDGLTSLEGKDHSLHLVFETDGLLE